MAVGWLVRVVEPAQHSQNLIILSLYHHLCDQGLTLQAHVSQTLHVPRKGLALVQLPEEISECLD